MTKKEPPVSLEQRTFLQTHMDQGKCRLSTGNKDKDTRPWGHQRGLMEQPHSFLSGHFLPHVSTDHSPHAPEKGSSAFPADGASSKEMVTAGPWAARAPRLWALGCCEQLLRSLEEGVHLGVAPCLFVVTPVILALDLTPSEKEDLPGSWAFLTVTDRSN